MPYRSDNNHGLKLLTEEALLVCDHETGHVKNKPSQYFVTIQHKRVLVDNDPENRPIDGCDNIGATMKPCQHTLKVDTGYSEFMRIGGKRICLDTVSGFTDGTPPGLIKYKVRRSGQDFVSQAAG